MTLGNVSSCPCELIQADDLSRAPFKLEIRAAQIQLMVKLVKKYRHYPWFFTTLKSGVLFYFLVNGTYLWVPEFIFL